MLGITSCVSRGKRPLVPKSFLSITLSPPKTGLRKQNISRLPDNKSILIPAELINVNQPNMKIIEALKSVKALAVKADDLRKKIATHSAYISIENPVYKDQKEQVAKWLQAHEDVLREIASLSVRIAKTNLAIIVKIKIGDNVLEKSITEWVLRRRTLAGLDLLAWSALTDRNLKEQLLGSSSPGGEPTKISIIRCYEPTVRDDKVAVYKAEPNTIDVALETVNAVTDLLE